MKTKDLGAPNPSFEDWRYDERPNVILDSANIQIEKIMKKSEMTEDEVVLDKELFDELILIGDQLSEKIEFYENDPVISEYMDMRRELYTPLFIMIEKGDWKSIKLIERWNTIIGLFQDEGLVGPFIDPNSDYPELDDDSGA